MTPQIPHHHIQGPNAFPSIRLTSLFPSTFPHSTLLHHGLPNLPRQPRPDSPSVPSQLQASSPRDAYTISFLAPSAACVS